MRAPERPTAVRLAKPEYDMNASSDLTVELEALGNGCTTIDFANVRYVDSSCLTQLIRACAQIKAAGTHEKLTLINLQPQVRRIFEITQLGRYFDLQ